MTKQEYRQIRSSIGSQSLVASMLGVTVRTIIRRENGEQNITQEQAIALLAIAEKMGMCDPDAIEAQVMRENRPKAKLPKKPVDNMSPCA